MFASEAKTVEGMGSTDSTYLKVNSFAFYLKIVENDMAECMEDYPQPAFTSRATTSKRSNRVDMIH